MTSLRIYQVDAFTSEVFKGNPATVCLMPPGTSLSDSAHLKIAQEMNLSETAYVEPVDRSTDENPFKICGQFKLRWFTPSSEVALCGHATLASAAALCQGEGNETGTLLFDTVHSGQLSVRRVDGAVAQPLLQLRMLFNDPIDSLPDGISPNADFIKCVVGEASIEDIAFHSGLQYLLIQLKDGPASSIANIEPDLVSLRALQETSDPVFGIIVAAATDDDPVHMRFRAAWTLDWEDAVTGCAQSVLGPRFERHLGSGSIRVHQASKRGGELALDVDRSARCVYAAGQCAIVFDGYLHLPASVC